MGMNTQRYIATQQWAGELDQVFTLADLKVVLNEQSVATFYRAVAALTENGALIKVKRGIYATPDAKLTDISSRIEPLSYISTGTVLAEKAIIGSIPARRVQAVKVGKPRTYRCETGVIEHLSIAPKLYFGFVSRDGKLVARPEKAFLDTCYYQFKGKRFSFDPASDVNMEDLDVPLIKEYLTKYDQRFITYFNTIWSLP